MSKRVFELDFYGRKIVVENGELAKQADGAVLVRYGDTVVLSTAVVSKLLIYYLISFHLWFYTKKNYILLVKYQEDLLKGKESLRMLQHLLQE